MKILHIFDHSLPLHSGYTFRSAAIIREQRKVGWQTSHLTTPRYNSADNAYDDVDGLRFHRTKLPAWGASINGLLRQSLEMIVTTPRLIKLARTEQADVLHAHSPVLNAVPAIIAGYWLGKPVVYEIRAFWEDAAVDLGGTRQGSLRYRLTRQVETWACKAVSRVTTICEGLRSELVRRGIPDEKISVVRNAVDADTLQPVVAKDSELRESLALKDDMIIGFFGSFYHYEGLDLLIRALPAIRARIPNARLLLVGGGPEHDKLKRIAREGDVSEAVLFTGRVPNGEIHRYYSLADVAAFPRRSMRLTELVTPLKPLEAMALGIPVLASSVGGHRELIDDEQTGILFSPDSTDSLAGAICDLLENEAKRKTLIDNGRTEVQTKRTWERSVAQYRQVYGAITEETI